MAVRVLNDQHNSASYMLSMDGMCVAVYLLYLMLVLYIWAVALCCACYAVADSGHYAAQCVVVGWTPEASIFPVLEYAIQVILIFVP